MKPEPMIEAPSARGSVPGNAFAVDWIGDPIAPVLVNGTSSPLARMFVKLIGDDAAIDEPPRQNSLSLEITDIGPPRAPSEPAPAYDAQAPLPPPFAISDIVTSVLAP